MSSPSAPTQALDLFGAPSAATKRAPSAFDEMGFAAALGALLEEVIALYLADQIPWVIGYSGGKDSSATTQLVWLALLAIPPEKRTKVVHVISTDTLVENPIVSRWADASLKAMQVAAAAQGLPVLVHRLTPALEDSYWVNLIGRGYAAPRNLFRWCTDRLKIKPSNTFIRAIISASGETVLVLGTRKAESAGRAARMKKLEAHRIRDRLSPNANLPGALVYSPIEEWSNDDVWLFLMQKKNPWGANNKDLLTLYQGASDGGECPLVVDTGTPSCGSSRFGCWVCTLVEQDKSMTAMIQNDADKDWMRPLLDFRNALDFRLHDDGDRHLRDFRRMNGKVQLMTTSAGPRVIPGPYLQAARADWLRRLLAAEQEVRRLGPETVREIELVTMAELREIRRIWVEEKHELEDLLPGIVEAARGVSFPTDRLGVPGISPEDLGMLMEAAEGDEELYALARDLLAVEHGYRLHTRRAGLFKALGDVLDRYTYSSEEEAIASLPAPGARGAQLALLGEPAPLVPPPSSMARRGRARRLLAKVTGGEGALGALAGQVAEDLEEPSEPS